MRFGAVHQREAAAVARRNTGPILAPFNAWIILKGLETLELRARKQAENGLIVGRYLESRVPRILHPGLPSHPQFELAQRQMSLPGSVFAFEVEGGRAAAHALLDALELIDISNHFGDTRTLLCHNASTTHSSLTEEVRLDMGVSQGMLRISVGLEDPKVDRRPRPGIGQGGDLASGLSDGAGPVAAPCIPR